MESDIRCASCDIELGADHVLADGQLFCCNGCAQGGPCLCTYEGSSARYPRNGHNPWRVILDIPSDWNSVSGPLDQ